MKKFISFSVFIMAVLCFVGPASAATTTTTEKFLTPQQLHTAAIKKANNDYNAAVKKANADYKAALAAAKAQLEKTKKELQANMKSAKSMADLILKTTAQSNKKVTLNTAKNASLGMILVASKNMTVYTKNDDTTQSSTCYGTCAGNWPPLIGTGVAGKDVKGSVGTIKRTDGLTQITYDGKPLYFWKGDKKPGDATGNGIGKIWSIVKP